MYDFIKLLKKFENKLGEVNPNLIQSMNKGIANRIDIELIFKSKNLDATDELICFYQWKNGIDTSKIVLDYRALFIPFNPFFELKTMAEYYDLLVDNNFIKKSFFPLCTEDVYLINLDKDSKTYGKIFFYSTGFLILEPISIFDSLKTMLLSIIDCFNDEALVYDSYGYIVINWDLYDSICKKNNPNSDYWKTKK